MNTVNEAEVSRSATFSSFLRENKKYIVMAAIALVVILSAVAVFDFMSSKKAEKSIVLAEDIEDLLQDYLLAADEDKGSVYEDLTVLIAQAKSDYTGLYAHMRALNSEARVMAEKEEWNEAAEAFIAIADKFPKSYMASISLVNAATMKEEAGDRTGSIALLDRVVEDYAGLSADIPETLFNLGRLSELSGELDAASAYYQRISDDYSSSGWTNLAKSRIIALNTGK